MKTTNLKVRFFTVSMITIILLSVPAFLNAQSSSVSNANAFMTALDDPSISTINLGSTTLNIRRTDPDDSDLFLDFIPEDIDRVITITSTGTTTIRYSSSASQTAENDGVEYYFNIIDGGEMRFSNAANLSGGYSSVGLFCVLDGNLTFDKTATLTGNKSTSRGGAIYVESAGTSTLTFKENAIFTSNIVEGSGGAVGMLESIMNVTGDATFTSNSAEGDGGALWLANDSTLTIGGNATFSKNTANGGYGGAISASGGILTFNGTFNAEENLTSGDGGALYIDTSATMTIAGAATFKKNKAGNDFEEGDDNSGSGGAIYASGGTLHFMDTATFGGTASGDGNTAKTAGGALYGDGNVEIIFEKTALFQNNSVSAGDGGALYIDGGILNFKADTTFQNNKSTDGLSGGGAIYATGSDAVLTFQGTLTQFLNNSAVLDLETDGANGGAVYLDRVGETTPGSPVFGWNAQGKMIFSGNQGVQGGAIFATSSALQFNEVEFTGNTATFQNPDPDDDTADGGGGALYVADSSYVVFNGPTTVQSNKAANGSGGAFFVTNSGSVDVDNPEYGVVFKGVTTITANEAQRGGAFFLDTSAISFDGTTTITGNKATKNGGAFYLRDSQVSFAGTAVISGNTGTGLGGALYVTGNHSIIQVEDNSTLTISAGNGTATNDVYLDEGSLLQLHTVGATSSLTIASNISSHADGADIQKTGEGSVYIDGDASAFVGNLIIDGGEFYIGKAGTFGNVDSTTLEIGDEGRLVLDVGDNVHSASPGDARISIATLNLSSGGIGPRIVAKALNDSDVSNPEKYAFITIDGDETTLQDYIDENLIGSNFDFLEFHSEITYNATDDTSTLWVWLTYDSTTHDWQFDLPRINDEFTLNAQLNDPSKPLTVSGPGKLKLNNDNTVAGLSDAAGKSSGNLEILNGHSLTLAGDTDSSFSGNIDGTGKLIVDGNLTQTLTGTNSYTGGTEVQNGNLVGNSDSLQGNITVNQPGTLTFDQTTYSGHEGTYSGQLTGNGDLNIEGQTVERGAQSDSVLRFTGNSSGFSGATNIKSGWLVLSENGNLSNSDISIGSSGGLGGYGSVGNVTIAQGGALQAFEGRLNINGDLEYTSGGIMYVIIDVDDQGNAINVVDVAGVARLDNVTVDVVGVNNYAESTDYTFLTTGEGFDGTQFNNSSDTFVDGDETWDFTFRQQGNDYVAKGTKSDT
ncbi:MAG: hypothetical protein LBQ50_04225, partial [Planctomycetaceae bacterium]|nr:hypothetical protein [Planctomycetaceae bacterium]